MSNHPDDFVFDVQGKLIGAPAHVNKQEWMEQLHETKGKEQKPKAKPRESIDALLQDSFFAADSKA